MKFFDEIGKERNEVLNEHYLVNGFKVRYEIKSKNFDLTSNVVNFPPKHQSISLEPHWKYRWNEFQAKISSDENSAKLITNHIYTMGTQMELGLNSTKTGVHGMFSSSYSNERFGIKAKLIYPQNPLKNPIQLSKEIVGQNGPTKFGLRLNTVVSHIREYSLESLFAYYLKNNSYFKTYLEYRFLNSEVNWGASFYNVLNPNTSLVFDLERRNSSQTVFTIGAQSKISDTTIVKAKTSVTGPEEKKEWRIGFSVQHKLSRYFTTIISGDLNPRAFLDQRESIPPHSFGFEFKIE